MLITYEMKKIILLLCLLASFVFANAQCWKTVRIGNSVNLAYAIKNDGSLWYWENSTYNQIGDSAFSIASLPERVDTSLSWQSIWGSPAGFHVLAQKKDGTLWGYGDNQYGELGIGTNDHGSGVPARIGTDNDWRSVSVGEQFSIATKNDGTLWAWGLNFYGNLGDGTTIDKNVPTQIGVANDWSYVSAGSIFSVAIKKDGTLWSWGYNQLGQLGNGTTDSSHNPVQIGTDNDWSFVSSGFDHSLAIKKNGTLWGWGLNVSGQLGNGTTNNSNIPIQIGTDINWKYVSAGYFYSLGIKTDGSAWSWGSNDNGELGIGTDTEMDSPTRIGTDNNWSEVSAGSDYSVAIKTDSTLWQWGGSPSFHVTIDNVPTPILCQGAPDTIGGLLLPIKLISFTAQKQLETTLLNWQTASEQNNKEYQIERSGDGNTFKEIGIIASKNNLSGSHYTYVDAYPLSGINYYRLKSVDIDGKFSYSNIDKVTFNLIANNVIVYPNPAKDILTVQSNFKGKRLNITITDLAGRKILQTIKQNNQLIEIPIFDLRAGFYLLKINDGMTSVSKKIIKE